MKTVLARCCVFGLVFVLVACTATTPTAEPTAVPSPTIESTATPVPPTDTPAPTSTATPVPRPALTHLLFGTHADLSDGQPAPATFAVGVPMLYASVDATALPSDGRIEWKLTRNGYELFDDRERITEGTGTLTRTLFENSRSILPGDYRLVAIAANQMQDGHFVVSADQSPPGTTLMFDNFDDNTLHWSLSSDSRQASHIQDGQLRLEAKAPEEYASVSASPVDVGDFDYSVAIKPEDGSAPGWATLWFRWSSHGGYALNLYPEGAFSVFSGSYVSVDPIVEYRRNAAIKRSGSNTVRIVGQDDKFAIYINDELVSTFTDKKYSSGDFAFGVASDKKGGVVYLFDNVLLTTPREQVTMLPTPTQSAPSTPRATTAPAATATPKQPPLADTIVRTRQHVESLGGALDRLYHGGGAEACGPLLSDYFSVVGAPTYDVSAQPANVQNAYGLYQQAINLISAKLQSIAQVCLSGGGTVGRLDFDLARQSINDAGSLLTQAQQALAQ